MTLPAYSQLKKGLAVNIVLKADQPTGKLTTGYINDILTRGNHPRGIKVRLTSGQVGRIQSLSNTIVPAKETFRAPEDRALSTASFGGAGGSQGRLSKGVHGYKMQSDYRLDDTAPEERTLEDYVVVKSKRKGKRAPQVPVIAEEEVSAQSQMEIEFPKLDSALIAAILAEHSSPVQAREVLQALA